LGADLRRRWGGGTCVIATPKLVDALMKKVPRCKVTTINEIRAALAKEHGAEIACPITTGIFASIAAHVAEEDRAKRKRGATPYWRTLKAGGEINPKYPGGVEAQKMLLQAEGHTVAVQGRRALVKDLDKKAFNLARR
jgi:alkylated DNA nucleotide flippase Atl1